MTRVSDRVRWDVPAGAERDMAEFGAWHTFGVDQVDKRIEVRA